MVGGATKIVFPVELFDHIKVVPSTGDDVVDKEVWEPAHTVLLPEMFGGFGNGVTDAVTAKRSALSMPDTVWVA